MLVELYQKKGLAYYSMRNYHATLENFKEASTHDPRAEIYLKKVFLDTKLYAERKEENPGRESGEKRKIMEEIVSLRTAQIEAGNLAADFKLRNTTMMEQLGFAYLSRANNYYELGNRLAAVEDYKKAISVLEGFGRKQLVAQLCVQVVDMDNGKDTEAFAVKCAELYEQLYKEKKLGHEELGSYYSVLRYLVQEKKLNKYKKQLRDIEVQLTIPGRS